MLSLPPELHDPEILRQLAADAGIGAAAGLLGHLFWRVARHLGLITEAEPINSVVSIPGSPDQDRKKGFFSGPFAPMYLGTVLGLLWGSLNLLSDNSLHSLGVIFAALGLWQTGVALSRVFNDADEVGVAAAQGAESDDLQLSPRARLAFALGNFVFAFLILAFQR